MSDWQEALLGDVLTLQRGFDLPQQKRTDGPFPVVSSAGVTGAHSEFKVQPPGVVIGRYGSLGTVHWIEDPFWPLNTSLWVKDFKGNDPRFISYLLQTLTLDSSAAAAVPGVNRNHLHKLPVRYPRRPVQRRIAAILATFDELIKLNGRRIELLEDLACSLYREWFVRFRYPGHSQIGLLDSELGLIPSGWGIHPLGEIATLHYGKALPARKRNVGDVPVISSAGVIDTHDHALVDGPGIVVGRKGNVGSVWWSNDAFFPIDTAFYVSSELPLGFLYWQLSELNFIDAHAAVPGLSRDQAYRLPVLRPPRSLCLEFSRTHDKLFRSIAAYSTHAKALAATRDLLLPRLITGRLDTADLDLDLLLTIDEAA
jgi:type I restriction enzyme, S subunit